MVYLACADRYCTLPNTKSINQSKDVTETVGEATTESKWMILHECIRDKMREWWEIFTMITCETLRKPPPPEPERRAAGRPAGAEPSGNGQDDRSERWFPARPPLNSRAVCKPLHYIPGCATAFREREKIEIDWVKITHSCQKLKSKG